MRVHLAVLMAVAVIILAAVPLLAHHSFAAEFDSAKPISLSGVVTKVEWMNPHVYFYVDAKDDSGKEVNYAVETGAPNGLYRQGWRKDSLKAGDTVTVEGYMAKDGTKNMANARSVKLPDGRRVFGGSSADASQ